MIGETVTVERFITSGSNAHNQGTGTWTPETVDDVLVAPGPRTDIPDVERPAGTIVAYTLHFPKTFTGVLRGARVTVRGEPGFEVIGDPRPYTGENTPTRWHMPVEVKRADG